MAETNGNQYTRIDRIEKALEHSMAYREQFRQDHKQLLIAQVVQSDQIAELVKVTAAHTEQFRMTAKRSIESDARMDKLVSAIGELISRVPPSALA